jgi:hypothetical protein
MAGAEKWFNPNTYNENQDDTYSGQSGPTEPRSWKEEFWYGVLGIAFGVALFAGIIYLAIRYNPYR